MRACANSFGIPHFCSTSCLHTSDGRILFTSQGPCCRRIQSGYTSASQLPLMSAFFCSLIRSLLTMTLMCIASVSASRLCLNWSNWYGSCFHAFCACSFIFQLPLVYDCSALVPIVCALLSRLCLAMALFHCY